MDILKKKIGIVGGGQLGKMMILEAKRLGFFIAVLDPDPNCPASSISDVHVIAGFDDAKGYIELANQVDVITYEFEHINASALEALGNDGHTIYPSVKSLKTIQNKFLQKEVLKKANLPIPRFVKVNSLDDIVSLGDPSHFGYPIMLKTTTGGYDGKGNALIMNESEVERAYQTLGNGTKELMAEAFVDFDKEISIIACRGIDGARVIYPLAENIHKNSILDTTIVPARVSESTIKKAEDLADKVMETFEGVGTFCIELFLTKSGEVFINEVAPRPHNSGHYTIEGCFANQFENHIRGIVGLPFGSTDLIAPTVMVNLLGESDGTAKVEGLEEAYQDPHVHLHIYGKHLSKVARKMGHFTVTGKTVESVINKSQQIKQIVRIVGE